MSRIGLNYPAATCWALISQHSPATRTRTQRLRRSWLGMAGGQALCGEGSPWQPARRSRDWENTAIKNSWGANSCPSEISVMNRGDSRITTLCWTVFPFPTSFSDTCTRSDDPVLTTIRLTGTEISELLDHFLKTTVGAQRKAVLAASAKTLSKLSPLPHMKHIVPDIRIQFKQPSMILRKTQSNTQPLKSMSSVCQAARSFCGGWDCRLRSTVTNLIPVLNTSSNWSQQRCSSFTLLWKDMMPKFKWLHCWLLIKEWGLNSDCISINKTPVISTR